MAAVLDFKPRLILVTQSGNLSQDGRDRSHLMAKVLFSRPTCLSRFPLFWTAYGYVYIIDSAPPINLTALSLVYSGPV